ncbi:YeeE/YedE family protein [Dasania marina]|uniref:YeeE/YedE family protein n=1 Tax=Dasania marina TaxID=471499 RepID=UPI000373E815|nr:YeeE/YedE family protein [Dasania marina]|tara:strand:+ start:5270 stop:5719 length:450 start_codon:yes stop_codon:yes gene_type:complete
MTITTFTPWTGLLGGILIGLAAVAWLWLYGRVTGISGILGGLTLDRQPGERSWRGWYLLGLIVGAVIYQWLASAGLPGEHYQVDLQVGWPLTIVAGLLVGFGTRMGNGCTSGHGVCGLANTSVRSLAATATFMATGFLTVFIVRHVVGA